MLPLYNQELWVSMKATVAASASAAPSTYSAHYSRKSTGALPAMTASAGGTLTYMMYDPPLNKIKIMYTVST